MSQIFTGLHRCLASTIPAALLLACSVASVHAADVPAQPPKNAATASDSQADAISSASKRMLERGRWIFRHDPFGSEAFWGGELRLHDAIAGAKNGGVGVGVRPTDGTSSQRRVAAVVLPWAALSSATVTVIR